MLTSGVDAFGTDMPATRVGAVWRRFSVRCRYDPASLRPPASVCVLTLVVVGLGFLLAQGLLVGHRYAFVRVIGMNLRMESCRYVTLTGLSDRLPAVDPETGQKTCRASLAF